MLWLTIVLIIISIVLTTLVLVQSRSAGLGSAFGGGAQGVYVRRGGEKRIFQATVAVGTLFILIAFAHLFVR